MKKLFLNEQVTLAVVLINIFIIFLQECGLENAILAGLDILCTIIFLIEMVLKQHYKGFRNYWSNGWDILDGSITLISLPSLLVYFVPIIPSLKILVTLRALRVFKVFRTVRHFPHLRETWVGFKLALRQSAAFLLAYFVIIVVIAMLNSALFSKTAPEYFGTPLDGIYTIFQMFTIEGWYEVPNAVVGEMPPIWTHIVRTYFCFLLIGGGIIGMSLINSIFVDAMAADNNDDVKSRLDELKNELEENRNQMRTMMEDMKKLLESKKETE